MQHRERILQIYQKKHEELNQKLSKKEVGEGESVEGYHFIFMCDRSGSMLGETRTVVNCVENFLSSRKNEGIPVAYSLIAFDDKVD
jgi:hypothetical protein